MNALTDHTIAFTGLKDGRHAFHYDLGPDFFAAAEQEDFQSGQVAVDVTMDKSTHMLVTVIHVDGSVTVHCDHCNALMDQAVKGEQRQIFQLSEEPMEDEDEELVTLDPTAHEINLTHYIFECITLHIPIRRVHAPGLCDPEVDSALSHLATEEPEQDPDPRWAALQKLKATKR